MVKVPQATILERQADYNGPQELHQRRLVEGAIGTSEIYHRGRFVCIYSFFLFEMRESSYYLLVQHLAFEPLTK